MKLSHSFVVDSPLPEVWELFDHLDRVVPCMPGAAYLGGEAEQHRVAMKVRIGAIVSNFQGSVGFVDRDDAHHAVRMRGVAKDSGGKGSATALIESRLAAVTPQRTQVDVVTDLVMSGRLAQFGGPIVADIAERLVGQFTANLHQELQRRAAPGTVPAQAASRQHAAAEAPAGAPAGTPGPALVSAPGWASASEPSTAASGAGGPAAEVPALDLGPVLGASLARLAARSLLPFAAGCAAGWAVARLW